MSLLLMLLQPDLDFAVAIANPLRGDYAQATNMGLVLGEDCNACPAGMHPNSVSAMTY